MIPNIRPSVRTFVRHEVKETWFSQLLFKIEGWNFLTFPTLLSISNNHIPAPIWSFPTKKNSSSSVVNKKLSFRQKIILLYISLRTFVKLKYYVLDGVEVCFNYAHHGHCPKGNQCEQSHDIDHIIK